ncbi:hypothetical protein M0654_00850 [Rhizobium sp. NTR19]|uniref:DUF883 domain-containing protein n=1 Tax=Neorhizobium turbinariae TaxID=2937795 RepID=A0ABT0IKY1_9HYPH|nr:hypothetical protein [Neorhizobium turbinariae]MCK8778518.1 hypothetical protein [Neorhizobium turbinariae]
MARDIAHQISILQDQLADLSRSLTRQASSSASDASATLGPLARHAASHLRQHGLDLTRQAQRNSTATGVALGALAAGTLLGFFLAGSLRKDD